MNANELRELAQWLDDGSIGKGGRIAIADYLRACADALEKGPVAWRIRIPGESELGHWFGEVPLGEGYTNEALYPLAMPGALRLPEPMTDEAIYDNDAIMAANSLAGLLFGDFATVVRAIEAEVLRRVKECNE